MSEDEESGGTNRVGEARPKTAEETLESGVRREKTAEEARDVEKRDPRYR